MFLKVLIYVSGLISLGCCVSLDDTELLLTYVVFRHGERTPVESELYFSDDPTTLAELSAPWGYGNLIDKGKQRGFYIGSFLRNRYNSLLSNKYNSTELYFRATDVDRTKMTGLTAMAALYPPVGPRWNQAVDWNPVPYTTVPADYDFLASYSNCERLTTYIYGILDGAVGTSIPGMDQYEDLMVYLTKQTGMNYTSYPSLIYTLYDTYQSELALGMTLKDWVLEIYDELEEATNTLTKAMYSPEDALRLGGGILLNDFLNVSQSIINDEEVTQRVRLYAAHDVNVEAQMAAIKVLNGYQKYGSTIAMELRRGHNTTDYYVLPVHILSPGETEMVYLQVEGCSDIFCPFDEFLSLTSSYAINQTEFEYLCTNGDDIEIE